MTGAQIAFFVLAVVAVASALGVVPEAARVEPAGAPAAAGP